MKRVSKLISRYLLGAVVPYFLFSWVLLTVILFLQQASRYSELFFNVNIPSSLIWQLMIGLVPNVIAFTCPMAVLVGTIIGLSKMQGDSELTAIRAAGVGNFQIAVPILILGILLSVFTLFVNLKGVPLLPHSYAKLRCGRPFQNSSHPSSRAYSTRRSMVLLSLHAIQIQKPATSRAFLSHNRMLRMGSTG